MLPRVLLLAGVLPCAACSSVIEGTSQQIMVNTNPSGASCTLMRQGQALGTINPTPGTLQIRKTKYDITVLCDKPGFMQATYLNHSGAAGATFGNMILGGGVGWAVDSATGADNKYDSPVNMSLVPQMPGTLPSSPPTASASKASVAGVPGKDIVQCKKDGVIEMRERAGCLRDGGDTIEVSRVQ